MDELTINFGSPFGSLTIISSYERQWAQQGSNLRPLACKASALPLSYAPVPPSSIPQIPGGNPAQRTPGPASTGADARAQASPRQAGLSGPPRRTRVILLPMSTSSLCQATKDPENHVAVVRAFNRFYTNVIGLLQEGLLATPYSLTEARVIFELAGRDYPDATGLRRVLDIDAGYLSRVLARLEGGQLISRQRSAGDGRRLEIGLTEQGWAAFRMLDMRSASQISELLDRLSGADQRRLTSAMATVREIIQDTPRPAGYVLRAPLPGDLGWVIRQHGAVYADEYRWDSSFESLVARIVADYAERQDTARRGAGQNDAAREAAWISEGNGEPAGCVFCMRKSDTPEIGRA